VIEAVVVAAAVVVSWSSSAAQFLEWYDKNCFSGYCL
jgi:hypothetical protein